MSDTVKNEDEKGPTEELRDDQKSAAGELRRRARCSRAQKPGSEGSKRKGQTQNERLEIRNPERKRKSWLSSWKQV